MLPQRISGQKIPLQDADRQNRRFMAAVLMVAVSLSVGACDTTSDIVDAVNPINLFDDDEDEPAEKAEVPGENDPYPPIGSVPEKPETPAISLEGDIVREGLVADKQHARYTDQVIRHAAVPERVSPLPQQVEALAKVPEPPPSVTVENGQTQVQRAPEPVPVAAPVVEEASTVGLTSRDPVTGAADPPPAPVVREPVAEPLVRRAEPAQPAPEPEPITVDSAGVAQAATPPPSAAPLAQEQVVAATNTAAPAVPKPAPGEIQHVATIYFPNGGAKMTDNDRRVVAQVMDLFRAGASRIRVVGHASKSGVSDPERANLVNYKSSLDRATSVAKAFLVNGVLQQQIEISAVGASQPRYSEDTAAGIAGNQRAEVFLKY